MRKIIAALQVSLDGFIEGSNGELDWVGTWDDSFDDMFPQIDTCILGRGMYPGYEQYWLAILANPDGTLPFTGKVAWKTTRIVRDVEEIRNMKQHSGKDIYAVGGATLVSSLMTLGLIDEFRLVVHPIVLGGGKALFKDVKERHALKLLGAKPLKSGMVCLTYST